MNRRTLITALLLGANTFLPAASPVDPVNKDRRGIAVKGYDVTAYFQQGTPAKGSPEFAHSWNAAIWHFQSAPARDALKPTPRSMRRNTAVTARGQ